MKKLFCLFLIVWMLAGCAPEQAVSTSSESVSTEAVSSEKVSSETTSENEKEPFPKQTELRFEHEGEEGYYIEKGVCYVTKDTFDCIYPMPFVGDGAIKWSNDSSLQTKCFPL